MTTPSDAAKTPKSELKRSGDSAKAKQMSPADAARVELHGGAPGMPGIAAVFGDNLFEQWVDQVRSDPRYALADPDDPQGTTASTNSSGSTPPPALIVGYGPGQNDYVSTVFDAGQVIVQDGNDPTGKAWKYPEPAWRRFVARVRGEEVPQDPANDGPTQFEEAALLQERTMKGLQADREATADARQRATEQR
jgi:hypothetical protein